jgi:hypothetical protein
MTKALQRILLSSVLATAAACSSSSTSTPDGSAGTDGGSDAAAGTTGAAGSTGDAGTTGAAGSDGGAPDAPSTTDGTGAAGSDGGSGDTSPADGGGTTTTTTALTAATGGTVPVTGGSLKIPAGALSADTTITVKELTPDANTPNKDLINGLIYDLGPDGTKFKTPVELTIAVTGTIPTGKLATLAYLDASTKTWQPISSNVVGAAGAQKVVGLTSHFTPYAILLVPEGTQCPAPAACGGSLVGSWVITTFCQQKPSKPVVIDCKDGTYQTAYATISAGGTFTVSANNTYTFVNEIVATRNVSSPPACIALRNASVPADKQVTTCQQIEPELTKEFSATTTCQGTVAAGCTCIATTVMPGESAGTVATEGTTFTTTKTGGQPETSSYCVQGDVLTVTTKDGFVYTGKKKP